MYSILFNSFDIIWLLNIVYSLFISVSQNKLEGTVWLDLDDLNVFKQLDLEDMEKTFSAYQRQQVTHQRHKGMMRILTRLLLYYKRLTLCSKCILWEILWCQAVSVHSSVLDHPFFLHDVYSCPFIYFLI